MLEFKFIAQFLRHVWLQYSVQPATYVEPFGNGRVMPPENGVVQHLPAIINRSDPEFRPRIMFHKMISTLGNRTKHFHKIVVVAYHFIVDLAIMDVPKSKVEGISVQPLEQNHFLNNAFRADTGKGIVAAVFGWFNVVSLPQHVQSFFALSNESSPTCLNPIILTQ